MTNSDRILAALTFAVKSLKAELDSGEMRDITFDVHMRSHPRPPQVDVTPRYQVELPAALR